MCGANSTWTEYSNKAFRIIVVYNWGIMQINFVVKDIYNNVYNKVHVFRVVQCSWVYFLSPSLFFDGREGNVILWDSLKHSGAL